MEDLREDVFLWPEALSKIGKKIRTKVDFSGVPAGTTGVVLRPCSDDLTPEGNVRLLGVMWELPDRVGSPLVDWFSKSEYMLYLEEIC